ncbi:DNA-binding domain-containing protein, partial [Acinetobacter baumannii]
YRRGYRARLTEALGETYEAVWRVLGDEEFFSATRSFIAEEPSRSYNLSDYGQRFPDFLSARYQQEAGFLGHLAHLEWAFKSCFHS